MAEFKIIAKKAARAIFFESVKPYQPLLVMALLVALSTLLLSARFHLHWMPLFMGLFLLNFSMFKLFDITGFAKSFAMYDIVAQRSRHYALAYPFVELALACGYLTHWHLPTVNMITIIIMGIGLIGIVRNQRSKSTTKCACMGSLLNVPVGAVTIIENTAMILMALMSILF